MRRSVLLGFSAGLLPVNALLCQDVDPAALKKLSLEELSEVQITTVSKEPVPAFRTPAAVFVITQEDIRRSGATNIPDLLRLAPGVEVAQIDSSKWAVGIRGFQGRLSRSVRVLIDGRSLYTPLFAGVYWEMQDTMIEDIDRIEVIRGPGGTIWGANAVNGVINIITKNAKETKGTLVSAGGGNVEQGFLNWRYGGGGDRLSYRVYGRGFTRAPQQNVNNRDYDDWRLGQIGFRADWTANERDTVTVQGDAYGIVAGQRVSISRYSPPSIPTVEANGDFSGQNVRMGWRRVLSPESNIQFNAYYDRTDRQDLNYREIRHAIDVDFIHRLRARRHEVTWGAGARISPSKYFQTVPVVDFQPHDQAYNIYSGFLQDEISLIPDRLAFTLGTKIEHNSFSGFEYQPSGRVSWTPNRRNTVWGSVTRAVRTPSRIEDNFQLTFLAQPSVPLYLRLIGDGQFQPEQLIGYEFGYRRYFERRGFLRISTFHNRYDDLLSVESRPVEPEATPEPPHLIQPLLLRNGVEGETSGVEIWGLLDTAKWWRLRGSYSFVGLNARNQRGSNDASTVRQLEGDTPSHKVVAESAFNLPRGFELDLFFRHVSAAANQRVRAYSTGDLRIGRRVGRQLDISLAGRNLLQPEHEEYGGSVAPIVRIKRSVYLKVTWTPGSR